MFNVYRYILEVERCGSIRIAAGNLHVSPSAISRHIKLAEIDFGTPLFERTTRGVAPTAAGQMYLSHARSVINDGARVRLEIDDLKGLRRGHLRIATIDGIVSGPLSDALSSFKKLYPGITFQLRSTGADVVTKLLRDGEADIGVTYNATPDNGVSVAKRIADPLLLVMAPGHPLSRRPTVDFKEALNFPIALPEQTFGIRKHVDAFCQFRRIALQPDLETNSIEALRGFARSGAGVTMLHYLSIKRDLELGLVAAVPFRNKVLHRSWVEICSQKGRPLPLAAGHFIYQLKLAFSA
jgi:DNA-binding transcriptional LysR family regulator